MKAIFQRQDRAYCMDPNGTPDLVARQLYCVSEIKMTPDGTQMLSLVGMGMSRYLARRFVRVADPAGRKWPRAQK